MNIERDKGTFIRHDACPDCGSSDALGVYDDHYVLLQLPNAYASGTR